MIRRFIEKKKVRLTQEGLCEADACGLPARKMTDILHELRLGEAEPECDAANAALKVVAIHRLKACDEIPVCGKFLRTSLPRSNRMLHPLLFIAQCDEVGECTAQLLIERIMGKRRLLFDIADGIGAIHHHLTTVVFFASEQDAHQRRLTRAVRTDKPHLVPAHDLEVHVGKQCTYAIRLFESDHLQTSHITLLHPHARHPGGSRARRSRSPAARPPHQRA